MMKKIIYGINLFMISITMPFSFHVDIDKRRLKSIDVFNGVADAQIILIGESHSDPFYKNWIISNLDRLKNLSITYLAIEIIPASYQSLLDAYFEAPTEEIKKEIWKMLYKNLYLIHEMGESLIVTLDEYDEIEENLAEDMEAGRYDSEIKEMADNYLRLINETVRRGIKIIGIGTTFFEFYHITIQGYENYMAERIKDYSKGGKILILAGAGHISPRIAEEKGMPIYGDLPEILSQAGYTCHTLFPK